MECVVALLFDVGNVRKHDLLVNSLSVGRRGEIADTVEIGDVGRAVVGHCVFGTFIHIHDEQKNIHVMDFLLLSKNESILGIDKYISHGKGSRVGN